MQPVLKVIKLCFQLFVEDLEDRKEGKQVKTTTPTENNNQNNNNNKTLRKKYGDCPVQLRWNKAASAEFSRKRRDLWFGP